MLALDINYHGTTIFWGLTVTSLNVMYFDEDSKSLSTGVVDSETRVAVSNAFRGNFFLFAGFLWSHRKALGADIANFLQFAKNSLGLLNDLIPWNYHLKLSLRKIVINFRCLDVLKWRKNKREARCKSVKTLNFTYHHHTLLACSWKPSRQCVQRVHGHWSFKVFLAHPVTFC